MLKVTDGNTAVYYTRGFELISRREGTTASYYVYDGGLSVRSLTNESGSVTDTLVFDAFGNETNRTGTTDNPYGFQGEERDATGLYYLRARYMDPATGTFTTMDTYGGSLSDPMSLHKYLFANSNPVMYSDPSGHMTLAEECGVMACIGAMCGALTYVVDAFITDPTMENHSIKGLVNNIILYAVIAVLVVLSIELLALIWGVLFGLIIQFGSIVFQWIDKISNKQTAELNYTGQTCGPFNEVLNSNGGTIWVSNQPVEQFDVVRLYEELGSDINVISGVDGGQNGQVVQNLKFLAEDLCNLSGVRLYDYNSYSLNYLSQIVNSDEVTVLAWCFSEFSKLASRIF